MIRCPRINNNTNMFCESLPCKFRQNIMVKQSNHRIYNVLNSTRSSINDLSLLFNDIYLKTRLSPFKENDQYIPRKCR